MTNKDDSIRQAVRERYAGFASEDKSCCDPAPAKESGCCAPGADVGCGCGPTAEAVGTELGYTDEQLAAVPDGSNLGLGCGNPTALADLSPGDTVLDLGSGGGFDCFLAARQVGLSGSVIGVDMTPEMLDRARGNAEREGYENVEFRLGEIENLPVADGSVDAIISNCVVNLSPDKPRVFSEAFRVLAPGGRLMVSDIVLTEPLPASVAASLDAYAGCISGASMRDAYLQAVADAGFEDIDVVTERGFDIDDDLFGADLLADAAGVGISDEDARRAAGAVRSISVRAVKPV